MTHIITSFPPSIPTSLPPSLPPYPAKILPGTNRPAAASGNAR